MKNEGFKKGKKPYAYGEVDFSLADGQFTLAREIVEEAEAKRLGFIAQYLFGNLEIEALETPEETGKKAMKLLKRINFGSPGEAPMLNGHPIKATAFYPPKSFYMYLEEEKNDGRKV